ncbi:DNA topoisomerase 2 [uncultured virus]|nr:DNA topoisomerase 2 [uncultured virus]
MSSLTEAELLAQHEERAKAFRTLDDIDHILTRPNVVIDSVKPEPRKYWIFTATGMAKKLITVPFGLGHIFREILNNAGDNVNRTDEYKYGSATSPDRGTIEVKMDDYTISVKNAGYPMPVGFSEADQRYIPESSFGHPKSGSSFGENRSGSGSNGLGSKAANIFSLEFLVKIQNPIAKIFYEQRWENNMRKCHPPTRKPYNGKASSVEVTYTVDMKRFGVEKYTQEAYQLFKGYAATASFTAKIPVIFNGEKLQYASIRDYATLFIGKIGKSVIHYQWPDSKSNPAIVTKSGFGIEGSKNALPFVEAIIIDTPGKGIQLGYANHTTNENGGVHVNTVLDAYTIAIKNALNDKPPPIRGQGRGRGRGGRGRGQTLSVEIPKSDTVPGVKLTITDFKKHLTVIVNVNVAGPEFSGQTKLTFKGPMHKVIADPEKIEQIMKWGLIDQMKAVLKGKALTITSAPKKDMMGSFTMHGDDAILAGGPERANTTLALMEGNSAEGYWRIWLGFDQWGRKRTGLFPIRGKLINVLKKDLIDVLKNPEVIELISRLGLDPNLDYRIDANFKKLNYGRLLISTDADIDGAHITGLILAFFHKLFPTLLERNDFVYQWLSPQIRARKGKEYKKFYFTHEYHAWAKVTPDADNWDYEYFKGLGRSTKVNVKEDYHDPRIIRLIYDIHAPAKLNMAFMKDQKNCKYTDMRKEWIAQWGPNIKIPQITNNTLNISDFVDYHLRAYSHATLARHIPGIDGLTTIRRKVIYTGFKSWGRMCVSKKQMKLTNFAADVSQRTNYHQGDGIPKAAIGLAQDFVGSNNIVAFNGIGGYGTIDEGGKDASQFRYLEITCNALMPYLFRPEDDKSLEILKDEGQDIEPKLLLPILPYVLFNGSNNVATGWKSFIPNYHPLEVCRQFQDRLLKGIPFSSLMPWWRNYQGSTEIVETTSKMGFPKRCLILTGVVSECTQNSYTVSVLPIGKWIQKYKAELIKMKTEGKITGYENLCADERVEFRVFGMNLKDENGNPRPIQLEDIKLQTKFGLNNMVLLDEHQKPVCYQDEVELMNSFYDYRLPFFGKRKLSMIEKLKAEIKLLESRIAYMDAILQGKLLFAIGKIRRKRPEILADIEKLGLNPAFYMSQKRPKGEEVEDEEKLVIKKVNFCDVDEEGFNDLVKKLKKLEEELALLMKVTPEMMWVKDLEEFKAKYLSIYGDDRRKVSIYI